MYIIALVANIVLILFDRFTKSMAMKHLEPIRQITIIDGVFNLTYVENRGAAFGILQDARWFFVILTIIVLSVIIYYFHVMPKNKVYNWLRVALVLISSGAVGNFIDRLFNGFVVDFLHFSLIDFPVFNIADIFVVVGTCLLSVLLLFFVKDGGGNTNKRPDTDSLNE